MLLACMHLQMVDSEKDCTHTHQSVDNEINVGISRQTVVIYARPSSKQIENACVQ